MTVLRTVCAAIALAFMTFSRIPMPHAVWMGPGMRYMMAAFPLVGVVVGAVLCAWALLCDAAGFGPLLWAAGVALLPVAITGAIHLDGFCDVVDASASHASPEHKRQILKDPHTGAFASIAVAAYVVLYVALATEIDVTLRAAVLLGAAHVLVRACSGLATVLFAKASDSGMCATFQDAADKRAVAAVLGMFACAALAAAAWAIPAAAACMAVVAGACMAVLHRFAFRQFGGMSGDLAGWFLQVAEIALVAVVVVVGKVVGL